MPRTIATVDERSKLPKAEIVKSTTAVPAKKIAATIAPSTPTARARVTRPALSDLTVSIRLLRKVSRRARPSAAPSRPWAIRLICRPMSSRSPKPCWVIAARTSGASATRSTSFWASSDWSRRSQTLSTRGLSRALIAARSTAGLAKRRSTASSTAGPSSTRTSARSTAGLSRARTMASSVARSMASSMPVASTTTRALRALPPRSRAAIEGRRVGRWSSAISSGG